MVLVRFPRTTCLLVHRWGPLVAEGWAWHICTSGGIQLGTERLPPTSVLLKPPHLVWVGQRPTPSS